MKDKIFVFLFMIYIIIFGSLHFIIKDKKISETERRTLSNFPKLTLSNNYIADVETYMLEQFPYRDNFRSIKANYNYKFLKMLDNNEIYLKDNYIYKSIYPTNKNSINYFINNINKTKKYLTNNNTVYMMIIPDKNYYLNSKNFLHIDYDYIYNEINKLNLVNIDIRNVLSIKDYYETDTHWKQENLINVIKEMSIYMNYDYQEYLYNKNFYRNFYGIYYGEAAIKRGPETLTYLSNEIINNATVNYLENKQLMSVYNFKKLNSFDSYEVYLDGASSYIEIYNNSLVNNKELIIFRDSFASSLVPLLIPYYSKITLIDNRYINSENYLKYVEFNNQDILFMYSTLLINNSFSLKN